MKDKKTLIIAGVVALLLLVGGGIFVLSNRGDSSGEETKKVKKEIQSIDAKELGLEIVPSADKRYVTFRMTNLKDIKNLEWEFTYDADNPDTSDGGEERITQGFGGEADIEPGEKEYISEERELGTCSTGGKCRFDTGIEEVNLIMKITKNDDSVYQSEASLKF